jgi:hypothetical protein
MLLSSRKVVKFLSISRFSILSKSAWSAHGRQRLAYRSSSEGQGAAFLSNRLRVLTLERQRHRAGATHRVEFAERAPHFVCVVILDPLKNNP